MSYSAFEHARNEHVPVDEFTDFVRDAPSCENCGSYDLAERDDMIHFQAVVFHVCMECGGEMHSEEEEAYDNRRQHFKEGYVEAHAAYVRRQIGGNFPRKATP